MAIQTCPTAMVQAPADRVWHLLTTPSILDAAEKIAPTDPRPPLEKGLKLMRAEMPGQASSQFERALALAPDDVMALNNYGAALAALGLKRWRDRGVPPCVLGRSLLGERPSQSGAAGCYVPG